MTNSALLQGTVVVMDDDEVTLRLLKVNLEQQGYAAACERTGRAGLVLAQRLVPDLVLSDALLPDMDGLQVCAQILNNSRTRHIPVMLMSGQFAAHQIVAALNAGADDYLRKPLDYHLVIARVRALIRRAQLKPATNPLTGLPGNLLIEHEIRQLITPGHGPFAVLYADFNNFKPYNDVYGFPAGDEAIRMMARVLTKAVTEQGNPGDFVGHVGGDDFVLITTPAKAEIVAEQIINDFDRAVPGLYNPVDRQRKYITAKDRQGLIKKFPLLGVAIAIVHNEHRPITSHLEIGEIGAELKHQAKANPTSHYVKDQRRAGRRGGG